MRAIFQIQWQSAINHHGNTITGEVEGHPVPLVVIEPALAGNHDARGIVQSHPGVVETDAQLVVGGLGKETG